MNKIRIVAWREYWVVARTPMFWLSTFGFPIFMVMCAVIPLLIGFSLANNDEDAKTEDHRYGVVDANQILPWEEPSFWTPPSLAQRSESQGLEMVPETLRPAVKNLLDEAPAVEPTLYFTVYASEAAARGAVSDGDVQAALVLAEDFTQSFAAQFILPDEDTSYGDLKNRTNKALRNAFLQRAYPSTEPDNIMRPLRQAEVTFLQKPPEKEPGELMKTVRKYALPGIMVFLLAMPLMIAMDRLLRGVVEEKENRVVEVLLSSVSPDELLFGKVLGLSGLAFTQATVWFGFGAIPLILMLNFLQVSLAMVALMGVLFVLGYLFTATTVLGLGSLGSNLQESTQMTLLVMLGWMSTLFFIQPVVANPLGVLARVLTYIPITAPGVILTRFISDGLPVWELVLALMVMTGWVWLAVKFGSLLFRLGIMTTGRMPKPREIWQALRQAGS